MPSARASTAASDCSTRWRHLGLGKPLVARTEGHVLFHRGREKLVGRILENHAHAAVQFALPQIANVVCSQEHFALLGMEQAHEHLQEGRLARTVGAHDGHHFALHRMERKVRERLDPIGIGKRDAAGFDGCRADDAIHEGHLSARMYAATMTATPAQAIAAWRQGNRGMAGSGKCP